MFGLAVKLSLKMTLPVLSACIRVLALAPANSMAIATGEHSARQPGMGALSASHSHIKVYRKEAESSLKSGDLSFFIF